MGCACHRPNRTRSHAWVVILAGLAGLAETSVACSSTAKNGNALPDAGASDAATNGPLGTCTDRGWCWENPVPSGADLVRVWATAADDYWTSGSDGLVLHTIGAATVATTLPTPETLRGLFATGPNDVWAAGGNTVFHWDGATWTKSLDEKAGRILTLWGTSPADIWVGRGDLVTHWNGMAWQNIAKIDGATVYDALAFTGRGKDDVWLGMSSGLFHWNGTRWSGPLPMGLNDQRPAALWESPTGTLWVRSEISVFAGVVGGTHGVHAYTIATSPQRADGPAAIWGTSDTDVWTTGGDRQGALLHFDGTAWSEFMLPVPGPIAGVHGTALDDIRAVGSHGVALHWDGTTWSTQANAGIPATEHVVAVTGAGPADVWTVGLLPDGRRMANHWDGITWSHIAVPSANGAGRDTADALWADGAGSVWVALPGDFAPQVLRWNGKTWERHLAARVTERYSKIWGSAPNDVWAGGITGMAHWDGTNWTTYNPFTVKGVPVEDLWGAGTADVYAVGGPYVAHWDGQAWTTTHIATTTATTVKYSSVWGSGSADVWVAPGPSMPPTMPPASVMHWDGAAWTASPGLTGEFRDIAGAAASDAWLEDSAGSLRHWDGSTWKAATSPVAVGMSPPAIWGQPGGDLWVAGERGVVVHGKTAAWKTLPRRPDGRATALTGTPSGGRYAVMDESLLGWDGSRWRVLFNASQPLSAVAAVDAAHVWAVGRHGAVVFWNGASGIESQGPWPNDLHGIWAASPTDLWVVGQAGALWHGNGVKWVVQPLPAGVRPADLWAVTGSDANDLWVCGDGPTMLHFSRGTWYPVAVPTQRNLAALAGSSPRGIWALSFGIAGVQDLIKWDGESWKSWTNPAWLSTSTSQAQGIWAGSDDDVWVAEGDKILRGNGAVWETLATPPGGVTTVWGDAGGGVWGAGEDGTIVQLRR